MKLETFFENFEFLTDAPNAVAKLHEIILQLAIRGKLVPQYANDEPASELIEKIKLRKIELDKKKKIKLTEKLPSIKEQEIAYKIPIGWEWVRFGDITICRDGERIPLSRDERVNRQGDYDYYGASGIIDKIDKFLFEQPLLLIGEDGANLINRSTPIAFIATGKYWVNNHAHVLDTISLDCLQYFKIYVNAIDLKPYITGTAQPKMNQAKMNSIPVSLPPLAEQKRIVEKCDRLLTICDDIEKHQQQRQESIVRMNESAITQLLSSQNPEEFRQHWQRICNNFDLLYSISETIPKLRQAILELAVQGKLVRQLPNEEPASKVLQKIKEEKEELAKQGIVVKEKTLASISLDELSFNIPESWIWVRLGQIVKSIRYGTSKHCSYEQNGVPILRIPNLINGKIDQQDLKFTVLSEKELLELKLERNDLLMIRSNGSKSLIGRTAIVSADVEGYGYAGYLVRLKIFLNYIDSRYLNLALDTNFVRYQIEIPIRTTSGVKNINSTEISNLILPLPPLGEQKRIVEKCDRLMSLCDTLEAKLKQGRDSSEKLMEVAAKQVLAS